MRAHLSKNINNGADLDTKNHICLHFSSIAFLTMTSVGQFGISEINFYLHFSPFHINTQFLGKSLPSILWRQYAQCLY